MVFRLILLSLDSENDVLSHRKKSLNNNILGLQKTKEVMNKPQKKTRMVMTDFGNMLNKKKFKYKPTSNHNIADGERVMLTS